MRATTDAEDMAMLKTTLPKFYDANNWARDPLNPDNVMNQGAQQAPRYRGAVSTVPNNTGGISTTQGDDLKLNHNDYIMFTGNNTGSWQNAFMYRWDVVNRRWNEIPRKGNWELYLDGVSDLTTNAPEGIFSTVFVKNLFAQTLNAEVANILFKLIVGSGDSGIEIDGKNRILKSTNFSANNAGFALKPDGSAEFNNIRIRGNGTFSGDLSAAGGTFTGKLTASSVAIDGSHEAGYYPTEASNPNIIGFDNREVYLTENISSGERIVKTIRIAGKGSYRFRLRFQGTYLLYIRLNNGRDIYFTSGISSSSSVDIWTQVFNTSDYNDNSEINIFVLKTLASGYADNTVFEARCFSSPGLFKALSSPF